MASPAPETKLAPCPARKHLSELYAEAVRALVSLHNAQSEAIKEGRPKPEGFEVALTVARDKREQAVLALLLHVQEHGC